MKKNNYTKFRGYTYNKTEKNIVKSVNTLIENVYNYLLQHMIRIYE